MPDHEPFSDTSVDPAVRGFLHRPASSPKDSVILTHGAGGNCRGALLTALANAFAIQDVMVLRCDLPFRQARSFGPPRPGDAARDRLGLKNAVGAMRKVAAGRIFLGGQSYGGRQATMLCAEEPELVNGMLLLSYPLHAPGKPDQLRTQHLPNLRIPAVFVHGTRDPFGSIEEMRSSLKLIPSPTLLVPVEGEGHDLGFKGKKRRDDLPPAIVAEFYKLLNQ
ncbi:MAG: alpha/beta hydrolase [Acidobacteriaceae bacterium]|nr:alpha/beta hydrolase [Acidobacteriaceae bacterium]